MKVIGKIYFWTLLVIMVSALLILFDEAPFFADDNVYVFLHSGTIQSLACHDRISSLSDIVESMVWHWQHYGNGRIVPHALLEFANMFPPIWAPLNTLMLALFALLIGKITGKKLSLSLALVVVALFWLTNPSPRSMIIWRAGSVNYLWSSVGALFAVYMWQRQELWSNRRVLLAIPAAFLIGNGNESITIGLAAGLLCLLVCYPKQAERFRKLLFLVAFSMGIAVNVFSPAAQGRLESMGCLEERIIKALTQDWLLIKGSYLPIVLMVVLAIVLACWKKSWRRFLSIERIWPLFAAFASGFVVNYSGNVFERSMYGVFFFLFLFAIRESLPLVENIRGKFSGMLVRVSAAGAVGLFALVVVVSCRHAVRNHERDMYIIDYCRTHPGQVCILPKAKPSGCISRWIMGGNKYSRANSMMAKYHHIPSICCRDDQSEQNLHSLFLKAGIGAEPLKERLRVGNEAVIIPLPEHMLSISATYGEEKKECCIDTCVVSGREIAVVWLPKEGESVSISLVAESEKFIWEEPTSGSL